MKLGVQDMQFLKKFFLRLGKLDQQRTLGFTHEYGVDVRNTFELLLKSDGPLLSIVVPNFNSGPFLEKAIESIFWQDYPHIEIIIQDNLSSDESGDYLKKLGKLNLPGVQIETAADRGQADAICTGFEKASGEILCWLNSDDMLVRGAVSRVASEMLLNRDVAVVYGDRLLINEKGMVTGTWGVPYHCAKTLVAADYIPQETLFFRREVYDSVGGLDASFKFALDWDFLLRIQNLFASTNDDSFKASILHIKRFLGFFRVHSQQKTQKLIAFEGHREMLQLRLRNGIVGIPAINKRIRFFLLVSVFYDFVVGNLNLMRQKKW